MLELSYRFKTWYTDLLLLPFKHVDFFHNLHIHFLHEIIALLP